MLGYHLYNAAEAASASGGDSVFRTRRSGQPAWRVVLVVHW